MRLSLSVEFGLASVRFIWVIISWSDHLETLLMVQFHEPVEPMYRINNGSFPVLTMRKTWQAVARPLTSKKPHGVVFFFAIELTSC